MIDRAEKFTPENVALLDAIEPLWRDDSLSMLDIGERLGVSRSRISGLIARERHRPGGAARFPARPKPASTRLSARRRRAIKAGMSSDDARVALPNAGRQLVRRPASAPKPAVLKPAPVEKPRALATFAQLKPGQCRFPVNDPLPHGEFLFCSAPALNGRYCSEHEAKTRVGLRASLR
jgi:hypothetical protein